MNEGLQLFGKKEKKSSDKDAVRKMDTLIFDALESLKGKSFHINKLNRLKQWNEEYENLPDDLESLEAFYNKLQEYLENREDALLSLEFVGEFSESEKDDIRKIDRKVREAAKYNENLLGNGATAEVYALNGNDMCVKIITNQERYNENNLLRVEFDYLLKVFIKTNGNNVRVPSPIFLRIHPNEGHSYGMEKIEGASLSQILENPQKYSELVVLAKTLNSSKYEENLIAFIEQMHEAGVTHGDLYTRNLMLDEQGRLFVIDFGKAQTIDFEGGRADERKLDLYVAQQSLREFFRKLENIDSDVN